jgi:GntR family transcriptional regulator
MLPSIRDLASSIRVNPNTVARSYREMESEGIVVARQGLGYMIITNRNQIRKIILEELKKDLSDYLIRYQKLGVTLDEVLEVIKTLWKENKV